MRPLSATECITPAIERTKLILFAPFRKGRTWKLSATAYLCRIGTIFFPFPLVYLVLLPTVRNSGSAAVVALCVAILIGAALWAYLFHVCSRLQFAYFDILVNRGEFVAPAWRKYGPQSRRWSGIKFLLGTGVTLACAVPIAAYIRHLMPLFQSMQSLAPGEPPPPQFMGAIFAGYGIILLVFGSFFLVSSVLADFLVPSFALENTSVGEAFRRMFALMRQEPGEFALYTLLKVGLAVAVYMGAMIAWEIVFILVSILLELLFGAIGFVLHLIGVPTVILIVLAVLIGGAWLIFTAGYTMMLTLGPVLTFFDAYALYFLAGRYPMLGDLLEPPNAQFAAASPLPNQPPPMPLESGAL